MKHTVISLALVLPLASVLFQLVYAPALAQISEEDVLKSLKNTQTQPLETTPEQQPLELTPIPRPSDAEILQLSQEGKEATNRVASVTNQMSMVIQICTNEINLQRNWALIFACKDLMEDFANTLDQFNEANVNRTLSIMLGSIP